MNVVGLSKMCRIFSLTYFQREFRQTLLPVRMLQDVYKATSFRCLPLLTLLHSHHVWQSYHLLMCISLAQPNSPRIREYCGCQICLFLQPLLDRGSDKAMDVSLELYKYLDSTEWLCSLSSLPLHLPWLEDIPIHTWFNYSDVSL